MNETPTIVPTPQAPVTPEFTEKVIGEVIPATGSSRKNISRKLIYIFLVLAVIVAGTIIYFLYTANKTPVAPIKETEEMTKPAILSPTLTPTPTVFPQESTSDEISAIEADLENTDFSNVDEGLIDIENEL